MRMCELLWTCASRCGHVSAIVDVCAPLWKCVSHCGWVSAVMGMRELLCVWQQQGALLRTQCHVTTANDHLA